MRKNNKEVNYDMYVCKFREDMTKRALERCAKYLAEKEKEENKDNE